MQERTREKKKEDDSEATNGGRKEEEIGGGGAYLTDNVVIVRQVVSVSLGSGRRGVAQFPYVWLGTVGRGGNREAVRLRLAALRAVLTGGKAQTCVSNLAIFWGCVALHAHTCVCEGAGSHS